MFCLQHFTSTHFWLCIWCYFQRCLFHKLGPPWSKLDPFHQWVLSMECLPSSVCVAIFSGSPVSFFLLRIFLYSRSSPAVSSAEWPLLCVVLYKLRNTVQGPSIKYVTLEGKGGPRRCDSLGQREGVKSMWRHAYNFFIIHIKHEI